MKFLIAPDKFKGSMTATQAAKAIAEGLREVLGEAATIDLCPLADGGEGTMDVLVNATGGRVYDQQVIGPLGDKVAAQWAMLGDGHTAVIEMSRAAGLQLVPPDQRNPALTTTYGVGQLILAALDRNPKKIIIGIGGSATNDGGTGMAQALGVTLQKGDDPHFMCGGQLQAITALSACNIDPRVMQTEIVVACDVTNPLCGPNGASHVYGPQKGATAAQLPMLDRGLENLASHLPDADPNQPGAGAAGGLGFGLLAFLNATIRPGTSIVFDAVQFTQRIAAADIIITGEGKLDKQSENGKTCAGVAALAQDHAKPCYAIVGATEPSVRIKGMTHVYPLLTSNAKSDIQHAMSNAEQLTREKAHELTELLDN